MKKTFRGKEHLRKELEKNPARAREYAENKWCGLSGFMTLYSVTPVIEAAPDHIHFHCVHASKRFSKL
ncbi:hypothetical protein PoB_000221600 [Plakobranchus ocellatus]|uniref:Uncharacterized protein n=1 Tax=Plakobranchus ocellatus TaxID=259542 RepID=A0AAV3X8I4_9GAST|nr:hypothetical protein PoB_000221600 [Plakobranchus ocellatus]